MGVEDLPNSGKSRRASRLNRLIAAALYPTRNNTAYEWGPDGRDVLHRFDPGAFLSSGQLSSEQRSELSNPRGFALAVIRHGGKAFLDSGSFSYFTDLDRKTTTYDIRLFPRLALRCQEVRARADATYAYAITGTLVAVEAPPAAPPVAAWPEPAAAPTEPAPYRPEPVGRPRKYGPQPTSGDALQAYIDEKIKVNYAGRAWRNQYTTAGGEDARQFVVDGGTVSCAICRTAPICVEINQCVGCTL